MRQLRGGWRKPAKSSDSGGDELAYALSHACRFQLLRSVLPLVPKRVALPPRNFLIVVADSLALAARMNMAKDDKVGVLEEADQGLASQRSVTERVLQTRRVEAHHI